MLLDRAVLVNLFSRSNSQKQARKSGGHVVGEFNRTDPSYMVDLVGSLVGWLFWLVSW